ncbi:MAG: glucose PTS transporter subunit IIA [Mycoplasmataceae bacterium]|nr:glucose PTS transporter subunit IIA [Mycoplasmataceae bacterium]
MNIKSIKSTKFYQAYDNRKNKGRAKSFFDQLSRGLMLPIAILPIAGLLLGIGGAIGANVTTEVGVIFANIFKGMSDVIFGNLPILFCIAITITFSKDKGASGFASAIAYLVFCSSQLAFLQFDADGKMKSIMWFHTEITGMSTSQLGLPTIQTSIFGGIVVGLLTSFIFNRVSILKVPKALDFFSGIRLVPIVLIPVMFLLSTAFLIFWPWIGLIILKMGEGIQGAPGGTGGLLYGILGRALMPFGLHHIPIVLAFQTPFGGVLTSTALESGILEAGVSVKDSATIMEAFNGFNNGGSIEGDQNIWNFINSLPFNDLNSPSGNIPIFDWFNQYTGVYAGRYTQDYPTYLGVCLGIGAAIIVASEKKNRRDVSVVVGSSMLVAFLTGITEPLEFTFLFAAPLLFYLIYVPLSGLSYMFMELAGAHVGVGFARGFIDLMIYGALPVLKGTRFYWAFVLAAGEGLFAFGAFYLLIKKFNISTPGRGGNVMKLITKDEYKNLKSTNKNGQDVRIMEIIKNLGGEQNLKDVSACATRLRVSVNDASNISKESFNALGSKGMVINNNSLQIIFGGEATIISEKINDYLNSNHGSVEEAKKEYTYKKTSFKKFNIYAPFDGEICSLDQVPDELFSQGLIGQGIAMIPHSSKVYSIVDGHLVNIFHTNHAYNFASKDGTEILVHIGIDTVENSDNIFDIIGQPGKVNLKSHISNIDLKEIENSKSSMTPIVLPDLNSSKKINIEVKYGQKVKAGDLIMSVENKI